MLVHPALGPVPVMVIEGAVSGPREGRRGTDGVDDFHGYLTFLRFDAATCLLPTQRFQHLIDTPLVHTEEAAILC
jgi:hypothetical protein